MYDLIDPERGVDAGLKYKTLDRISLRTIARAEPSANVPLYDQPLIRRGGVRVAGPFTVEALSRYAANPSDREVSAPDPAANTGDHVGVLIDALKVQGIPRPGGMP